MDHLSLRHLRLFRWLLIAVCVLCLLWLIPLIAFNAMAGLFADNGTLWSVFAETGNAGMIGGPDGPTAIITTTRALGPLETFLEIGLPFLLLIVCVILAVRVWRLEKKLK